MATYSLVFCIALIVHLCVLLIERALGIGLFFHIDSSYYVFQAQTLIDSGFSLSLVITHLINNGSYVVLCAFLIKATGNLEAIVLVNLLIGSLVPVSMMRFVRTFLGDDRNHALLAVGLVTALLPYLSHLSVHILKDVLFIELTLEFFIAYKRRRILLLLLLFFLSFSVRNYLTLFNASLVAIFMFDKKIRLYNIFSAIVFYSIMVACLSLSGLLGIFLERSEIYFEGRSFFYGLPPLRPTGSVEFYFQGLLAPLKGILLPNVLFAQSFSELMYIAHVTLMQVLFVLFMVGVLRKKFALKYSEKRVLFLCFTGFWFIEMTTPGYGPLVRYREFYVLILIAMILYLMKRKYRIAI